MLTETILDGLVPSDLGLPGRRFPGFRDIQRQAAQFGLYGRDGECGKRFVMMGIPTGAGKSLIAHAIGKLSGLRYAVITATRGLMDQQIEDQFPVMELRGQANYQCVRYNVKDPDNRWGCDQGYDKDCDAVGDRGCTYYDQLQRARKANVLTNYACWMAHRGRNRAALEDLAVGPIELLICDEFHLVPQELARHLATWINRQDLAKFGNERLMRDAMKTLGGKDWAVVDGVWPELFGVMGDKVRVEMVEIAEDYASETSSGTGAAFRLSSRYRTLDKLAGDIDRVARLGNDGNWIWHPTRNGISFGCIWPYRYAEQYLFSGVPHVVGMSATLRPKTMSLLGLKRTDYDYKEWPRVFPAHLSPVYYWPRGRMSKNASDEDLAESFKAVDEIFQARSDRKIIIHAVSYERAELFQARCVHAGRHMILSKPGMASIAAERFRLSRPPSVLCSPSFQTGWDFSDDQAEVIIVPKLPFSAKGDPIVQAREVDDQYELHKVAQDVQQAFGRATRHFTDRSEGFLTDKAWGWFQYAAKTHLSGWFRTRKIDRLPKAPERMTA